MTACKFESLTASPGRRDGFRLTPLRMCICGRGPARARLSCVPWLIPSGRPAERRQRRQACAQRRGDRDSGRARRGFSRPPSGLKWPRGVSSFMTQYQQLPATISPGVGFRAWLKEQHTASNGSQPTSRSRGPPRRSRECRAPDSDGACASPCERRCAPLVAKPTRAARCWSSLRGVLRSSRAEPSPRISRSARARRLQFSPPSARCDSV